VGRDGDRSPRGRVHTTAYPRPTHPASPAGRPPLVGEHQRPGGANVTRHRASPASVEYWEPRVDPDGKLSAEARRAKARSERDAYMARLAFNRSRARQAREAAALEPEPDEAA
jgi:hypothetical protein